MLPCMAGARTISWLQTLGSSISGGDGGAEEATEPRLSLVFECDRPLAGARWYSLADIHTVRIGRHPGHESERQSGVLTVRVPDRWMSSQHAELLFEFNRWQLIDAGSRNGCHVAGERVTRHEVGEGQLFELGRTFFMLQHAFPALEGKREGELNVDPELAGLETLNPALRREFARFARLASTPVSFLIQGESGTGKEVLARALHQLSGRSGAFVAVNSAAIPDTLIESELFGHKKGAFSGALGDRPGLIVSAHRGTFFLDETGDLPLSAQAALLRVLQEGEVRPVGDIRARPVDVRLVSATHKDLDAKIERDEFRQDLYARIAGAAIHLPALRERRSDLGMLIAALLPKVVSDTESVRFSIKAARALLAYHWPMNIRELENCLLTAAALAGDGRIELEHLPQNIAAEPLLSLQVGSQDGPQDGPQALKSPTSRPTSQLDRAGIVAALRENDDNVSMTARALGLSRQALYRRMNHFGIPHPGRKGLK